MTLGALSVVTRNWRIDKVVSQLGRGVDAVVDSIVMHCASLLSHEVLRGCETLAC